MNTRVFAKKFIPAVIIFSWIGLLGASDVWPKAIMMSLEERVKEADVIVYGQVTEKRDLGLVKVEGKQYRKYRNVVIPEKVLKGDWPVKKPMIFITLKFYLHGKPAKREDEMIFPDKGDLLIIFATRAGQDSFDPVGGRNGFVYFDESGKGFFSRLLKNSFVNKS